MRIQMGLVCAAAVIVLLAAGLSRASSTEQPLRLDLSLQAGGGGGTLVVSVTNTGDTDLYSVYLESAVPSGLAVSVSDGSIVGGVWRLVIPLLAPGKSAGAALDYTYLRAAASGFEIRAQGLGVSPVTASTTVPAPPVSLGVFVLLAFLVVLSAAIATRAAGQRPEHLFLLHRGGAVLASRGRTYRDPDLLGAMLVIIQHAMRRGLRDPSATLQEIHFDGRTLYLVHGRNALIAAVASGESRPRLKRRLASALRQFERANGQTLQRWNGELSGLHGLDRVLARV